MKKAAFAIALLAVSGSALAESSPKLTRAQEKLALYVARVSAHEGALKNPKDLDLVWQTTEAKGDTTEQRLKFIVAHSGRSAGVKEVQDNFVNAWSRELNGKGVIPASVAADDVGYFRTVTIPRFQKLLSRARQLVGGAPYDRPCSVDPFTWGGVGKEPKGADDREKAASEGLYPIGCKGTLNDGFTTKDKLK